MDNCSDIEKKKKKYIWKGRYVSEKVYNNRVRMSEASKKMKRQTDEKEESSVVQGNRIVNFKVMMDHMICGFCKEKLLLEYMEKEHTIGLASILSIRCNACLKLNSVPTSNVRTSQLSKRPRYDINVQSALGALHAGLGHSQLEKLFAVLDIPAPTAMSFKKYESLVGKAIEKVAKDSCNEAALLERDLTIKNVEKLKTLLPENVPDDFLMPTNESQPTSEVTTFYDVVRVLLSFDMGWTKRGTDSLNGFGAIIGMQSGKIIDYGTRNRVCNKCQRGHDKCDHDCRQNFSGSAKAMESDLGVQLMANSKVLKDHNLEIGAYIGDNDSATLSALRTACSHQVVKLADKNHTSKGVSTALYKIDKENDPSRELNSIVIKYFHDCFTYAMAQNKGNNETMSAAVRNIPFHAYNIHDNCGDWCGFKKDPENYEHATIPGGIKSPILFEKLKVLFGKLADNAKEYCAGASSNANESFHSSVSRFHPKAQCFSKSDSADVRVACAVANKNEGPKYLNSVLQNFDINLSNNFTKFIDTKTKSKMQIAMKQNTYDYKKQRMDRKIKRAQLRYRKQKQEGVMYETDMGLFGDDAIEGVQELDGQVAECADDSGIGLDVSDESVLIGDDNSINDNVESFEKDAGANVLDDENMNHDETKQLSKYNLIYFDLETSGFGRNCDILQIAMASKNDKFNMFVTPSQQIDPRASAVHGLTKQGRELFLHGVKIKTYSKLVVATKIIEFLTNLECTSILIAHNSSFDTPLILNFFKQVSLLEAFENLVIGFTDTLPLLREKYPLRKGKGAHTLVGLATDELKISIANAHDASYDIFLLQRLIQHARITYENIVEKCITIDEEIEKEKQYIKKKETLDTLSSLKPVLKTYMINKVASAGITLNLITSTYCNEGVEATTALLQQKVNNRCQLIKSDKILKSVLEFLKNNLKLIPKN